MTDLLHNPRARTACGALFIIIATFLAYLPAIRSGFIWDDDTHVTHNAALKRPDGLMLIWTRLGATPQYYPMTHTSFWIEHKLWGDRPLGYHVTNVALHVTSALLLWRILTLLGLTGAWLAATIFALHPIEVESVAWVTERKNVLSGALYFGAMLAYLRASRDGGAPSWGGYALALVLFVGAVLSKTVAGTLPAALALILWWRDGRLPWRHAPYLAPMFVVGVAMGLLTGRMERTVVGAAGPEWDWSVIERCLIAGRALWFYPYKLLVPVNLSFIYERWEIDARAAWQYLFPLAALLLVVALFVLRNRIGRGPLACVLYYGGTLFPALGFVNVYPHRYSFVADHFQYLAGVGLIVFISGIVSRAFAKPQARVGFTVTLALVLGVLTWHQAGMYRNARTLWERTLDRNPRAWIAHDHLGEILGATDPAAAAGHFAAAIELEPKHVEGYIGLGNLLLRRGDINGAIEQFRRAVAARPDKPLPYYHLGNALASAGDPAAAAGAHEQALDADPRFLFSRLRLVELYTRLGRGDDAERHRAEADRQRRELLGP